MSVREDPAKRVVVTGRHGQVARALAAAGHASGWEVVALGRPELDLNDPATIRALDEARPDVVINAAAMTAVDAAESNANEAFAINAEGAGRVAKAAACLGVPVIQISTDYVFDGRTARASRESDGVNPLNVYGRSKLGGEQAVASMAANHVVLRTSWVFDGLGRNFLRTMLRLARTRDQIAVVDDQRGCPTYAPDLARAALRVAKNLLAQPHAADMRGVFHAAGATSTTWAAFAQAIFAESRMQGGPSAIVEPVPTASYPTPARRPLHSVLDCGKLARVHDVRLSGYEDALPEAVASALAHPDA